MGGMWDDAYDNGADENSMGLIRYGVNDVRKQMADVKRFMAATNTDVLSALARGKVSQQFGSQWQDVWVKWQRFFDDFDGIPGVLMLHRDSTWERAANFQKAGEQFRTALEKLKHPVTPMKDILPEQRRAYDGGPIEIDLPTKNVGGFPWKWFIIGAGVAGAGYAGYKIFSQSPAAKTVAFLQGGEEKKKKEEDDE